VETKTSTVIDSSNPTIRVGEKCTFMDSNESIVLIQGDYYIIGKAKSKGYREYKCSDYYCNDVMAIVCIKIANQEACQKTITQNGKKHYAYPKVGAAEKTVELSTFWMNGTLFAIESQSICAALEGQDVTQVIGCDEIYVGMITWNNKTIPVASLAKYFQHTISYTKELNHIIVLKGSDNKPFGLVIDMVQDSPEIPVRCIDETSQVMLGAHTLTKAIVKADIGQEKTEMLSILDPLKIEKYLLLEKNNLLV
jgi:chemotaxis signal transduction protein